MDPEEWVIEKVKNKLNVVISTYAIGTIYMDLINSCEKLGDYVVNVVEARTGTRMRQ